MSISRVVPNIASDKLDASRDFYTALLGFQVAMDLGWILTLVSPTNPTPSSASYARMPRRPW